MPSKVKSFILLTWDLVLCAAGAVLLLWLDLPGTQPAGAFFDLLRLLLGIVYLFIVPGYLLQLTFFPIRLDLSNMARFALSFALSIALVAPVALVLDWLPWGIELWSSLLVWLVLIAILLLIAILRRWQVGLEICFVPHWDIGFYLDWESESETGRALLGMAALFLGIALVSGLGLTFTQRPSDRFTEFYILGPSGTASGYPISAVAGQSIYIFAGIHNQEKQAMDYLLQIKAGSNTIYQQIPVHLKDQDVLELPLSFMLPNTGPDQEVVLELLEFGSSVPYRKLRLFIDVEPSE